MIMKIVIEMRDYTILYNRVRTGFGRSMIVD